MKKLFINIVIALLVIILLEFVTVFILGNGELVRQVYKNTSDYNVGSRPDKLLVLYGDCQDNDPMDLDFDNPSRLPDFYNLPCEKIEPISASNRETLTNLFLEKFDSVNSIDNPHNLSEYHNDGNYIEYSFSFFKKYKLLSIVPEEIALYSVEASNYDFIKNRTTIYFWFFIKWVKLDTFDGGSS